MSYVFVTLSVMSYVFVTLTVMSYVFVTLTVMSYVSVEPYVIKALCGICLRMKENMQQKLCDSCDLIMMNFFGITKPQDLRRTCVQASRGRMFCLCIFICVFICVFFLFLFLLCVCVCRFFVWCADS